MNFKNKKDISVQAALIHKIPNNADFFIFLSILTLGLNYLLKSYL